MRRGLPRSWKGRLVRPFFVVASLVLASAAPADAARSVPAPAAASASASPGRMRPPPLACDANHLTVWPGRVTGYMRRKDSTWLRIATDDDTVESTTLRHPGEANAARHYRLNGAPFAAADFARIESKPGKLRAGMRARAWICDDGVTPPVIDWQPPTE
jgi:Tfp pilus assembly protein FimV